MILQGILDEFTPAEQEALLSNPRAVSYLESCLDKFAYTFRPRPNNPARYDEQEAFCHNHDTGVSFAVGGNAAGTTIAACYKLARFVTQVQEAPRYDTPFWIIGPSYEQTIESIWKEKLLGRGLILEGDIDWDRVTWYELRSGLPLRVPLKPWINGHPKRNWCLEFKSSEQGREQMQARSLGGFFFSEQFGWPLLTEVLRGMREYNFPGSKFAEFTPIDPVLSAPLEDMMERDELPEGWRVYRMNTKCNVEDPNSEVGEEWYNEFFGMVSDEMRETRETGAWSSYEGLIYPSFNRAVHLVENIEIPYGVIHKRGIDWGAGPDNAFVVLWGFKDSLGAWWIHDEYYSTRQDYTWEDHCAAIHAKDGWELIRKGDTWELDPLNSHVRWNYGMANYQVTYAPPDRPDLFREFGKYLLPCASANNNVNDGIESVRRLLKINEVTGEPKLFIDRIKCPNLARFMQTYRWMAAVKRSINKKDARPIPLKRDDHACTMVGSMLQSIDGNKPIECVKRGDRLLSHRGICTALTDGVMTGYRECVRVHLVDGTYLDCTDDHPFATGESSWERADSLLGRMANRLDLQAMNLVASGSCMMGRNGDGGLATKSEQMRSTLEMDESCFTAGYGWNETESPYNDRSTFTTNTDPMTTALKTLNCLEKSSTHRFIPDQLVRQSSGNASFAARSFSYPLGRGCESKNTVQTHADMKGCERSGRALFAERSSFRDTTRQRTGPRKRHAATIASTPCARNSERPCTKRSERLASTNELTNASDAESLSPSLVRQLARKNVRLVSVVKVERLAGLHAVYNLATSDGTYFANGILTSNCDALRYLAHSDATHAGLTVDNKWIAASKSGFKRPVNRHRFNQLERK